MSSSEVCGIIQRHVCAHDMPWAARLYKRLREGASKIKFSEGEELLGSLAQTH